MPDCLLGTLRFETMQGLPPLHVDDPIGRAGPRPSLTSDPRVPRGKLHPLNSEIPNPHIGRADPFAGDDHDLLDVPHSCSADDSCTTEYSVDCHALESGEFGIGYRPVMVAGA